MEKILMRSECEWREAAPGLKSLRLQCAPRETGDLVRKCGDVSRSAQ